MCGLCGYITKSGVSLDYAKRNKRARITTALHVAMTERGEDSAGIAFINGKRSLIIKKAVTPYKLVTMPEYVKAVNGNDPIAIGHTRFATVGTISDRNAHPFKRGTIIGAHNGSVSNYATIDSKVQVDSEVIFSELNKAKNDYLSVFPRLSGQFALTWLDTRQPDTIHLVRHDNPLSVVYVRELDTYFWCSTSLALVPVIISVFGTSKVKEYEIKPDTVYTISGNLGIKKTKVNFKTSYFYYTGKDGKTYGTGWESEDDYPLPDAGSSYGGSTGSYKKSSTGYSVAETIEWLYDNEDCTICNMPMKPTDGYYYNSESYDIAHSWCIESRGQQNAPGMMYVNKALLLRMKQAEQAERYD